MGGRRWRANGSWLVDKLSVTVGLIFVWFTRLKNTLLQTAFFLESSDCLLLFGSRTVGTFGRMFSIKKLFSRSLKPDSFHFCAFKRHPLDAIQIWWSKYNFKRKRLTWDSRIYRWPPQHTPPNRRVAWEGRVQSRIVLVGSRTTVGCRDWLRKKKKVRLGFESNELMLLVLPYKG